MHADTRKKLTCSIYRLNFLSAPLEFEFFGDFKSALKHCETLRSIERDTSYYCSVHNSLEASSGGCWSGSNYDPTDLILYIQLLNMQ